MEQLPDELYRAIRRGDEVLVAHLAESIPPATRSSLLLQALNLATFDQQLAVVLALLRAGADINAQDDHFECALTTAINRSPSLDFVEALLAAGADPNGAQQGRGMPLAEAARRSRADIVRLLLAAGADVNLRQHVTHLTPLHAACQSARNADTIRELLNAAAVMSVADQPSPAVDLLRNRYSPPEALKLLLAHGLDLKECSADVFQEASLHSLAALELLLRFGVPLSQPALNEALYRVVRFGLTTDPDPTLGEEASAPEPRGREAEEAAIIRKLISLGADPNASDWWALSRLRDATHLPLLIECGGDIDACDEDGYTPLHMAVRHPNHEAAEALILAGARALQDQSVKAWCARLGYMPRTQKLP